jgi:3,4-dihydroxy-2-butanone 4-phosphate synthase
MEKTRGKVPVEQAINAVKEGRLIIIIDDEDREN